MCNTFSIAALVVVVVVDEAVIATEEKSSVEQNKNRTEMLMIILFIAFTAPRANDLGGLGVFEHFVPFIIL